MGVCTPRAQDIKSGIYPGIRPRECLTVFGCRGAQEDTAELGELGDLLLRLVFKETLIALMNQLFESNPPLVVSL